MVQVITGEKGSGKTKKLISLANDLISQSKGHIIYISNSSENIFDLNSSVRLVDISQFPVSSIELFTGFIFGIISEDYDIESILIDNLNSILKENDDHLNDFVKNANYISGKFGINFILGFKGKSEKIPDLDVKYIAV